MVGATLRYERETNHCERTFAFLSSMCVHVTLRPNVKWHVHYMYSKADKFPPLKNFALRVYKRNHNFAALCFPVFLVPRFPGFRCSPCFPVFLCNATNSPFSLINGSKFCFFTQGSRNGCSPSISVLKPSISPTSGTVATLLVWWTCLVRHCSMWTHHLLKEQRVKAHS